MDKTGKTDFALPYPISHKISVYRDDGRWGEYRAWFLRTDRDLRDLYVCDYRLRTSKIDPEDEEEDEEVDLTAKEWREVAAKLVDRHPQHVFIYA